MVVEDSYNNTQQVMKHDTSYQDRATTERDLNDNALIHMPVVDRGHERPSTCVVRPLHDNPVRTCN